MGKIEMGQPGYGGERGGSGGEAPQDHLDQTARDWERAFWRALEEVRVEMLKDKIRAAWGRGIGETAGEVVAAMGEEWKRFHEAERRRQAAAEGAEEPGARGSVRAVLEKAMRKGPR